MKAIPQKFFFLEREIPLKEVAQRIGRSTAFTYAVLNNKIRPAVPTVEKIDQLIAEIRAQETETC